MIGLDPKAIRSMKEILQEIKKSGILPHARYILLDMELPKVEEIITLH